MLTGAGRASYAGVDLKALTDEPELLSSGLGLGPESPIVVALEHSEWPEALELAAIDKIWGFIFMNHVNTAWASATPKPRSSRMQVS